MRKKVYIIYTGGTIGMKPTENGYAPAKGFLREQMEAMSELKHDDMPEYDLHEYEPLLDSANMTPDNWTDIAMDIYNNYHEYDGFVILHGTDTMAYTASALSFMLEGLDKIVDEILGMYYINKNPGIYEVLEEDFGDEEYGVGLRLEDKKLVEELNRILKEMKEDGTMAEISKKWFGEDIVK